MTTRVAPWSHDDLVAHWDWRPEWAEDRPCLYWYATVRPGDVRRVFDRRAADLLLGTEWLDAVPPRWMHMTLCDVGFCDQLDDDVVGRVADGVAAEAGRLSPVRVELGPVVTMRSAVALPASPMDRLRALRAQVRDLTQAVTREPGSSSHAREFWPHVSLGYVNRPVPRREVTAFLDALPDLRACAVLDRLTLAAVTRRQRHYQWTIRGQVHLTG